MYNQTAWLLTQSTLLSRTDLSQSALSQTTTIKRPLKDLQGKIYIKGLDKVQNSMHAEEASLSQKRVSELEVEWSDVFDGSRNETLEKEVLNMLKPRNENLKNLGVVSYGGTKFPPLFFRLADVSIHGCKNCTSMPLLGRLPSLKKLSVKGMDEVKVMGSELFPLLEILSFEDMKRWEVWSTDNSRVFPRREELSLDGCPNLVHVSLEALPSLKVVRLRKCGEGVLTSLVHVAPSVTELEIDDISRLTDELWTGVTEYLGAVEEVSIKSCNEIRYLRASKAEASKVLVKLRMLKVASCEKLECCRFPNCIEYLRILDCDSVTSMTRGGQNLKFLDISDCKKLLETELGGGEKKGVLINSSMYKVLAKSEIDQ